MLIERTFDCEDTAIRVYHDLKIGKQHKNKKNVDIDVKWTKDGTKYYSVTYLLED